MRDWEQVNQKTHKVEKIYQVATWKEVFRNSQFCAVPMSSAHESCHFGRNVGKLLFFPKVSLHFMLSAYGRFG